MKIRCFTLTIISLTALSLSACQTTTQTLSNDISALGNSIFGNVNKKAASAADMERQEIVSAFKQALTMGTENVVAQLGQANGFKADPKVHIPLPSTLAKVRDGLETIGASYLLDDLESRLNRAAEIATPQAKVLFINAISEMTFDDIYSIYKGPQDSATTYFRQKMSAPLSAKMTPFVKDAISQAGVIKSYDQAMSKYQSIPFMPDVKADLTSYVVDQGIEGIFFYLAEQEKAIRQDSVRQTTDLLKKVFGNKMPNTSDN
jgi:predicted small secreted protein